MTSREAYDEDDAFWLKYLKGRPKIPDSFFQTIFAYHAEHGGQFATAHDAGAGAGVHTTRLSARFEKVIVSDPSEQNVRAAQTRLEQKDKYHFVISKLEDTIHHIDAGSVDLIFAANMLHFTDIDKATEAVAFQLKPGGTFAALAAGLCVLLDTKAHAIWLRLFQRGFSKVVEKFEKGASAYDAVPLPETVFRPGAQRIKLNMPNNRVWSEFQVPREMEDQYPPWSQIGANDEVTRKDAKEWTFKVDLAGLSDNWATFPFDKDDAELTRLWGELEALVGDRHIDAVWPVSLILATRA